jgi:hypothetical protein
VLLVCLYIQYFDTSLNYLEIHGQTGFLSWYPSTPTFEISGRYQNRWTEELDARFLLNERTDIAKEGLKRTPLSSSRWHNALRGSSDIHIAILHLNEEATKFIQQSIQ